MFTRRTQASEGLTKKLCRNDFKSYNARIFYGDLPSLILPLKKVHDQSKIYDEYVDTL